jgi:flagellar basal body-associated protein FliL
MYRTEQATRPREAMILIVVLCLLTLFAIIGISFVLYAESVALSSRLSVGAENVTLTPANSAAQQALNLFLGQFMYGTSDTASVLRGYDLATDLYGG